MPLNRITRNIARVVSAALLLAGPCRGGDAWPQFRGPTGQGTSDAAEAPVKWADPPDGASGRTPNIKFKTPIPGEGWSSPVIAGGQVWMTTATEAGRSLRAVCVDQETGAIVHNVEVFHVGAPENKNALNSFASPTPVLEEGRVYVCFGAYGSACLDGRTGAALWKNQDLRVNHLEGPGSSPVIYKDLFLLHCDGADAQYVIALDKNTGKTAWKANRSAPLGRRPPDQRKSFDTPLVVPVNGRDQIISVGAWRVSAYDPADGKELWWCDLTGWSNVPRPIVADGRVLVCTGYGRTELYAIRPDGAGDVTRTHVAWTTRPGVSCKPSLVLAGAGVYMIADNGIARCLDPKTGQTLWQKRLEGAYSASPVYAGGHVYFCSEQGLTTVVKPGPAPEVVAENPLDSRIMASPAVAGNALFLRTQKSLYRIEK